MHTKGNNVVVNAAGETFYVMSEFTSDNLIRHFYHRYDKKVMVGSWATLDTLINSLVMDGATEFSIYHYDHCGLRTAIKLTYQDLCWDAELILHYKYLSWFLRPIVKLFGIMFSPKQPANE